MCFKRWLHRLRPKKHPRFREMTVITQPSARALELLGRPRDRRAAIVQAREFVLYAQKEALPVPDPGRASGIAGSLADSREAAPDSGITEPVKLREYIIYSLEDDREPQVRYSRRDAPVVEVVQPASPPPPKPARLQDYWQTDFLTWQPVRERKQTFREFVLQALDERSIPPVDFYTAADLDRKLFSRMKNEPNYHPSKETAIRCCLALRLDAAQTEAALGLAGYSLSWSLAEDLAVRWCIQHRIYRVYEVMEVVSQVS